MFKCIFFWRALFIYTFLIITSTNVYAKTGSFPASLEVRLDSECDTKKDTTLGVRFAQPVALCAWKSTHLTASATNISALVGRKIYLKLHFSPSTKNVPLSLTMTAYDGIGHVKTHLGMYFEISQELLETSIYVPDGTASLYWTLSGGNGGLRQKNTGEIIRIEARASSAKFIPGTMCTACRRYLDEAIERVRRESLVSHHLQLDQLANSLRLAATGSQDIRDMDGPLKELSRKIAEAESGAGLMPHGRYQTKAEYDASASDMQATQALLAEGKAVARFFDSQLLNRRTGYIQLRFFLASDVAAGRAYANVLRKTIVDLHEQGATQWIIDLRNHGGGTLFPAIAALRPLLGSGAAGYFVDADGKQREAWLWGAPAASNGIADPYILGEYPPFDGADNPVAILIDDKTSSTGEMIAVAFHGRCHTRSFGAETAGYITGVSGQLDAYGNFLGITSTYTSDRNGQRIFPKLMPDIAVLRDTLRQDETDPVLAAATAWLEGQP